MFKRLLVILGIVIAVAQTSYSACADGGQQNSGDCGCVSEETFDARDSALEWLMDMQRLGYVTFGDAVLQDLSSVQENNLIMKNDYIRKKMATITIVPTIIVPLLLN